MENKEMIFEEAVDVAEEVLQKGKSFKFAKGLAGLGIGTVIGYYVIPKAVHRLKAANDKRRTIKAEKKAKTTDEVEIIVNQVEEN